MANRAASVNPVQLRSFLLKSRLLSMFILLLALLGLGWLFLISQAERDYAKELRAASGQGTDTLLQLMQGRKLLDNPKWGEPAYYASLNGSVQQMDKLFGAVKVTPEIEKDSKVKPETREHVMARALVLRDTLKNLSAKEKPLADFQALLPQIQAEINTIAGDKAILMPAAVPDDSPLKPVSQALDNAHKTLDLIRKAGPGVTDLYKLRPALQGIKEAVETATNPANAAKLNPRRVAAIEQVRATTVYKRAPEWMALLDGVQVIRNQGLALTDNMTTWSRIVESPPENLKQEGRWTHVFTLVLSCSALLIVVAVVQMFLMDRYVTPAVQQYTIFEQFNDPEKVQHWRDAGERVPYAQLAVKQVNDLSKQLLRAIQRMSLSLTDAQRAMNPQAGKQTSERLDQLKLGLNDIKDQLVALRERGIQLSLDISQGRDNSALMHESESLNADIEQMEKAAQTMQLLLNDQANAGMAKGDVEIGRLMKESEGLLMVTNQWMRQLERMNEALGDLDSTLTASLSGQPLLSKESLAPEAAETVTSTLEIKA